MANADQHAVNGITRKEQIAIGALVVGAVGAAAAWGVLDRSQALSASIFFAAVLPPLMLLSHRLRTSRRTPYVLAFTIFAVAGCAAWLSLQPGKAQSLGIGPADRTSPLVPARSASMSLSPTQSAVVVQIADPPEGGSTRTMPVCFTARGAGTLPPNLSLVIEVQQVDDTRRYFEADVRWQGSTWLAAVSLDRDNDASAGKTFTVSAVVLDRELASYLSKSSDVDGDTWWSNETRPPGAEGVDHVDVVRSKDQSGCPA